MKRLLLILLGAGAISARGGIDLTPSSKEYTAEGVTFRQLFFKDGQRQVVYELPRQWSYRARGDSLQLNPPNDRADASIQVAALPKPQPFDEKLLAALKDQSLRALPSGIQSTQTLAEEINPVRLENGDTYALTMSYQALGETFVRSTLYVNLPEVLLTFRLTARKAEFGSLERAFRSSILSWHWIEAKTPSSAVAQNSAGQ